MARERTPRSVALDIESTLPLNGDPSQLSGLQNLYAIAVAKPVSPDTAITQIIDNVIGHFDTLRKQIETANRKDDVYDVREAGDTFGAALLSGVEEQVSYDDLVNVINAMKLGNAHRRVTLQGVIDAVA